MKSWGFLMCLWALFKPMLDRVFTWSQPAMMHICRVMNTAQVLLTTGTVP